MLVAPTGSWFVSLFLIHRVAIAWWPADVTGADR